MDFTTGEPSEEALSQLIKSLVDFLMDEEFPPTAAEDPPAEDGSAGRLMENRGGTGAVRAL